MQQALLPVDIDAFLAKRVLGQADLLRRISVSLYKHIHGLPAPNVLLVGNSGTGKTTLMQAIVDLYDTYDDLMRFRVMVIVNANTLSAEVEGEDRTTRLFRKLEARARVLFGSALSARELSDYLENATVCVDEVDKISGRVSEKANVAGITTQYALLTLLEGERFLYRTTVVEDGREVEAELALDTGKLLFICGGAFEELYDQVYTLVVNRRDDRRLKEVSEVERRPDGSVSVRTVTRFKLRDYLRLADLFAYGMMPQFISRFGSIAMLDDLGKDELRQIFLSAPNSPLRLCLEYFRHMGIELRLTQEAATAIAEAAAKNSRIGARALREIFNGLIAPHEYDPFHSPLMCQTDQGPVLALDLETVTQYLTRMD
ncbi:MAG: AAA family ATPase [Solidesulfovibrio sp.]|uniref:AAA family ATPase n=1 Tax=Solidesulfovibrio sp. TaxID=2910990 RepID=UPI002B1F6079|nr:AAA family ATPase [Solidesulfovibrio sp.]MEA4858407.1 AAA family ATPase [Solidesulfovibrio sp.]